MPEYTPYFSPALALLSWVLYVAAAATPIIRWGNGWYYGPWSSCNGNGNCYSGSGSCSDAASARDAVAAFLIMNCILMILAVIWGVLRMFVAALQAGGCCKLVYVITLVICAVFGLIAWAVAFSLAGATYCGYRFLDNPDSRVGPCPILAVFAWVFNLIAIGLECKFTPGVKEEAAHQAENVTHHTTTTSTTHHHSSSSTTEHNHHQKETHHHQDTTTKSNNHPDENHDHHIETK